MRLLKMLKIFDLSRPLAKAEPVYPGNPKVNLKALKNFKRNGSVLSQLTLGLHSASHLDAPMHYVRHGASVDKTSLNKCVGWCRIVDAGKIQSEISAAEVKRFQPKLGEIILFKTKNSRPAKKFNPKFVHLNLSGAEVLVRAGIKAVGTDGPSIRKFHLKPDLVHPLLLKKGVLIYEGLNLKEIKPGRYFFVGVPLKIKGAEASPVRAIAIRD